MLCPLPRRLILQGDRRQEFFPFRVRGCAPGQLRGTSNLQPTSSDWTRPQLPSSAGALEQAAGCLDWHPPETPQKGALTHFLACSKLLTNFTRDLRFLSPLPPAIFFFLIQPSSSESKPCAHQVHTQTDVKPQALSTRHMSNWSAALDLGGLDIDSAFRETIFAHFRERFGRMVSTLHCPGRAVRFSSVGSAR